MLSCVLLGIWGLKFLMNKSGCDIRISPDYVFVTTTQNKDSFMCEREDSLHGKYVLEFV